MKEVVKVAAAQIEVDWLNPEVNLTRIQDSVEKIVEQHQTDLIVFDLPPVVVPVLTSLPKPT